MPRFHRQRAGLSKTYETIIAFTLICAKQPRKSGIIPWRLLPYSLRDEIGFGNNRVVLDAIGIGGFQTGVSHFLVGWKYSKVRCAFLGL